MKYSEIFVNQRIVATKTGFGGAVGAAAYAEKVGLAPPIIKDEVYVVDRTDSSDETLVVRAFIEWTGRMESLWVTATDFKPYKGSK